MILRKVLELFVICSGSYELYVGRSIIGSEDLGMFGIGFRIIVISLFALIFTNVITIDRIRTWISNE